MNNIYLDLTLLTSNQLIKLGKDLDKHYDVFITLRFDLSEGKTSNYFKYLYFEELDEYWIRTAEPCGKEVSYQEFRLLVLDKNSCKLD